MTLFVGPSIYPLRSSLSNVSAADMLAAFQARMLVTPS